MGLYRVYGLRIRVKGFGFRDSTPTVENQTEKQMENEMETDGLQLVVALLGMGLLAHVLRGLWGSGFRV